MNRWPHQIRGVTETENAHAAGCKRICLTSPTGGGKTRMQFDLAAESLERGDGVLLLSNRRMLLAQHARNAKAAGFEFGFRASDYKDLVSTAGMEFAFARAGKDEISARGLQLAMTQSEVNRLDRGEPLHPCKRVIVDEAHLHKSKAIREVLHRYVDAGAVVDGFTATPVDLRDVGYDRLIVAGTNSELRACGALVPAVTYAPDEPDTRGLKPQKTGEFKEGDVAKAIMTPVIFGRVYENWKILNPDALPALLSAPGVPESRWFAEQFWAAGVTAAHIDGETVWINGIEHKTTQELRDVVAKMSRDGELAIVCNRFVLREGIDWPWIMHGIFATIFGGISAFLQTGGRLLRAFSGKDRVIVQDHGGNYWRHGSLNSDREWRLGETNLEASQDRIDALRNKKDTGAVEPIRCPKCHRVRVPKGPTDLQCPFCEYTVRKHSRTVIQRDGSLLEMRGDILKPRRVVQEADTEKLWQQTYFRAKNSKNGMTFKQAQALFYREHGYEPPHTLTRMPVHERDWSRKVRDVAPTDLIGSSKRQEAEAG